MLAELKLELNQKINFNQSSNLQGVLMKNISTDYAGYLHRQSINPYSIAVYQENDKTIWSIRTLTHEAYENIIEPLLNDEFNQFVIYNGNRHIKILDKTLRKISLQRMVEMIGAGKVSDRINIKFVTPMAFKSEGRYICMPDVKMIYQNLLNKYSVISTGERMDIRETLDEMVKNTYVQKYEIKSVTFPVERQKIPGCVGEMELRIYGNDANKRLAELLFRFGEYSGVGVKCSIGMGRIKAI